MALSQAQFRFGDASSGNESTHGWLANQNTNHTLNVNGSNVNFLLRLLCQASGGVAHSNIDWTFQYNKNGAGWVSITTSSAVIRAVSVVLTNGGNCTNRLTGGTGTFESSAAGQTTDGTSGGTACDIVANGFTETECALQVIAADVNNGNTIEFRLLQEGALLNTYAVTPVLTISKPEGQPIRYRVGGVSGMHHGGIKFGRSW